MTTGGLGATDMGNQAAIGGVAREFYGRILKYYEDPAAWKQETREAYAKRERYIFKDAQFGFEPHVAEKIFNDMVAEAKVKVVLGQRLDLKNGVVKDGGADRFDQDGVGRGLRGKDVHRRDVRGGSDGEGGRVVHARARGERAVRRDAQRRAGRARAKSHQFGPEGRSVREAGRQEQRAAAERPRRRRRARTARRTSGCRRTTTASA